MEHLCVTNTHKIDHRCGMCVCVFLRAKKVKKQTFEPNSDFDRKFVFRLSAWSFWMICMTSLHSIELIYFVDRGAVPLVQYILNAFRRAADPFLWWHTTSHQLNHRHGKPIWRLCLLKNTIHVSQSAWKLIIDSSILTDPIITKYLRIPIKNVKIISNYKRNSAVYVCARKQSDTSLSCVRLHNELTIYHTHAYPINFSRVVFLTNRWTPQ